MVPGELSTLCLLESLPFPGSRIFGVVLWKPLPDCGVGAGRTILLPTETKNLETPLRTGLQTVLILSLLTPTSTSSSAWSCQLWGFWLTDRAGFPHSVLLAQDLIFSPFSGSV